MQNQVFHYEAPNLRLCVGVWSSYRLWLNNCLLSLSIINESISCWVLGQICRALIVGCLAGSFLSPTKLNRYWFSASYEGVMLNCELTLWGETHTVHLSERLLMCLSLTEWWEENYWICVHLSLLSF